MSHKLLKTKLMFRSAVRTRAQMSKLYPSILIASLSSYKKVGPHLKNKETNKEKIIWSHSILWNTMQQLKKERGEIICGLMWNKLYNICQNDKIKMENTDDSQLSFVFLKERNTNVCVYVLVVFWYLCGIGFRTPGGNQNFGC